MFGVRLKELREEKELSQQELAEQIGYNQSMISFWERGVNEPTESAIRKISMFFGVSADYLIGLEREDGTKEYEE